MQPPARNLPHAITDAISMQSRKHAGKLFFNDLLRLMTAKDEATTAGIRRTSIESKAVAAAGALAAGVGGGAADASDSRPRPPSLAALGRGLSLSDVVLNSEAEAAKASQRAFDARSAWVTRGRSVQNLNSFIKAAHKDR